MLQATNLIIKRSTRTVLNDAAIDIKPGQLLSVLGSNGAGKSSLLSTLAAELKLGKDSSGSVRIDHTNIYAITAAKLAKKRMVLPQKPGLAFDLNVLEVVQMGAYPFTSITNDQLDNICSEAMDLAEIADLANRPYLELSGGEQQRVQFARVSVQAICAQSNSHQNIYMLLDEPTASLDPMHQQLLLKSLTNMAHNKNVGVLVILHDINLACRWSDAIALISNQQIIACGSPDAVITKENIKTVYGVESYVLRHPDHPRIPMVVLR